MSQQAAIAQFITNNTKKLDKQFSDIENNIANLVLSHEHGSEANTSKKR